MAASIAVSPLHVNHMCHPEKVKKRFLTWPLRYNKIPMQQDGARSLFEYPAESIFRGYWIPPPNVEPPMFPKKFKDPVFIFNGSLLIVFIWMNHLADRFSERAQKFPKFVLGIGILALTFWMVAYLIFPGLLKFIEAQAEKEEDSAGNRSRYYGAWLCIAGSILMGYLFGFIFVVPTAFLSYGLIPGEKKRWISLIALMLVMTACFYVGFYRILHIPVLKGVVLDID